MTPRKRTTKKASAETWQSVLILDPNPVSRSTVRRHYAAWRREHQIPDRCDIPGCMFFAAPLEWNGRPLKLIVDHEDGNRYNNTPTNLRYLCPNCDGQLTTKGGGNRGRVEPGSVTRDGYILNNSDGTRIVAATGGAVGSAVVGAGGTRTYHRNILAFLESEQAYLRESGHESTAAEYDGPLAYLRDKIAKLERAKGAESASAAPSPPTSS